MASFASSIALHRAAEAAARDAARSPIRSPCTDRSPRGGIDAQQQPVLGPRGEQPVRLARSAGDEVVDEDCQIGFLAAENQRRRALDRQRRVDAGHQPESGRLLVSRRSVDLSREEQPANPLGLKRRRQLRRVDEVVLDRVTRTDHLGVFEPVDGPHHLELDLGGKRCREAVDVEERGVEPLGLEEELVSLPAGESDDLVLERRAVTRPSAFDHAGEHRRPVQVCRHDAVHALVRVGDVAGDLGQRDALRVFREKRGVDVSGLGLEPAEIDARAQETRRSSGLEAPESKSETMERRRQGV